MNITQNTQFDFDNAYEYVIRSIKHEIGCSWGIFLGKRLILRASYKDSLIESLRQLGFSYHDKNMFLSRTIVTPRTDYNILLTDRCLESLIHADKIAEIAEKLQSLGLIVSISDNCMDVYRDGVKIGFVDVSNTLKYGDARYGFERNIHTTKSVRTVITYFSNVMSR